MRRLASLLSRYAVRGQGEGCCAPPNPSADLQNPHPRLLPVDREKEYGRHLFAVFVFLIAVLPIAAVAEPIISLPLDGYYRPGKFFPVRITVDQPVDVRIDSPNGIGARGHGTSLTLPVMLLSTNARSIAIQINGKTTDLPVRSLEGNQQLVLTTLPAQVDRPFMLDPSKQPVVAAISPERLSDITAADESADVLLVSAAEFGKLSDAIVRKLLAAGITVAVNAGDAPASAWPWKRVGGWSVIDVPVRGPTTSTDDASVYEAAADFTFARTPAVRRTVFLSATLFSILALASTLLGRRSSYATGAITIIAIAAGLFYAARQTAVAERSAAVYVPGTFMAQRDEWTFRTRSVLGQDEWKSVGDMDRPIFAGQADSLSMWTEPSDAGPVFHYTLRPRQKVAFVRRVFIPPLADNGTGWTLGWEAAEPSNFDKLIREFYVRPGERIEVPSSKSGNPPSDFLVRVPLKAK